MTAAQRTLSTRWWVALLALFVFLAPLESFAAKPRAKKVVATKTHHASKAKHVTKARKVAQAKRAKSVKAGARKKVAAAPRRVVRIEMLPVDPDKLPLKARVAYVIDTESDEVLLGKNDDDVRPIASLTKLMTGLIVSEARLPMDDKITITSDDVDRVKHSSSRLQVGTVLTRSEALHLALMSSENRAAHALGRSYPGGLSAFVSAMNNKARQLGMLQTRYVDPTGLSSGNQSSARDLAVLAEAAYTHPLMRKYSTSRGYEIEAADGRELTYVNTNRLVREGAWKIGLQKTGYISEAGQCLLVQTQVKGRNLIMVFLDSASKITRIRDAEIVKRWLHQHGEV
ncbi:D-alanyl-D-alanine carboxypeptidase family protein [Ramlibacter alkalitolerans]|uniref:Serine hydrolase n=1 Tax=Ramlibacter alkalitolerans TaxID=2039631 RepID=A0ABS1JRN5_9BURK|nr:serine hydrolase [Ramlibacter alkalitolerans]MBL0426934.1 serine hydrolase [Ramlibacter alkalitolerans]